MNSGAANKAGAPRPRPLWPNAFWPSILAIAAALALCAVPALASFHFRLHRSAPAPDTATFPLQGARLTLYSCVSPAHTALEAAIHALAEEGWSLVFSTPSIALLENKHGRCAAIQAAAAPNGATTVAILVQEQSR
ncbi:MAG: hypothetical protein IKO40_10530 [Kiritimatiellae bacterium]|nr:hypothetical protein [Kiritimatiellia bacterium]